MKKSLLALAVLGAFAGTASAQSSVTLFGIIDLGYRNVENHDTSQSQMSQDGINSSRLGVRGVEDMGGGLRAGFWLEGAINPDTGTPSGQTWQRRSTVSLIGNWGEVRLGRDYTPGFWNTTIFDPFGTNGVGSFLNMAAAAPDGSAGNNLYVRASNSVGYFLPPNLGGFYGQVMINAGENTQPYTKLSYSLRLGWAGGPFNVAASFQETDATTPDATHNNLAGSWNFGFMTLMGQWDMVEVGKVRFMSPTCPPTSAALPPPAPTSTGTVATSSRSAMSTTCPSGRRCTARTRRFRTTAPRGSRSVT
jgi:predicted porin